MEQKQEILDKLLPALQATRALDNLKSLTYSREKETVTAVFESGGTRTINVAADSGIAMIQDVLNWIAR